MLKIYKYTLVVCATACVGQAVAATLPDIVANDIAANKVTTNTLETSVISTPSGNGNKIEITAGNFSVSNARGLSVAGNIAAANNMTSDQKGDITADGNITAYGDVAGYDVNVRHNVNAAHNVTAVGAVSAMSISFTNQKLCSATEPGMFRNDIVVPQTWTSNDCQKWATGIGASIFQIACITSHNVTYGQPNNGSSLTPSQNCGW